MSSNKRLPCGAIFRSPVIRSDGSITVCNFDLGLELKLGNIKEDNLFSLWESEKMQILRKNSILNENIPLKCKNCNPDYFLSRRETVKYIKKNLKRDILDKFLVRTCDKPKILLVNPLVSPKAPFKTCVTLGLGSIAAYISPYFEVEILNMNYSNIDNYSVANYIEENNFNIVGITGMTYQIMSGIKLLNIIKENTPEVITVAGGVFATMKPDFLMQYKQVDFLIKGEGEKAFLAFLENIQNQNTNFYEYPSLVWRNEENIVENQECDFLKPDEIPIIPRKILPSFGFIYDDSTFSDNPKEQTACVIMFSRGCPSNCIFCESPHMWKKKVRLMSIERIIKEIKYIIAEYNIRNFIIDDDAFTVFKDKIMEFCQRIIDEKLNIKWRCNTKVTMVTEELFIKMKEAGCLKVTYGIESGNINVLKNLNKNFTINQVRKAFALNKKTNLPASMLLIIGSPGESPNTVQDSINLIEEINPEGGWDFQIMQPHPGTTLRREINKFKGEILTDDWDEYYSDNITYIPDKFNKQEFLYWCKKVTKRPISLAGEKKVSFSENNEGIIKIPVDMWDFGEFDKLQPYYWNGEKNFQKGYTHVLGANKGYIKYNFNIEKIPEWILIKFTACSQINEKRSFLQIRINQYKIANIFIGPKDSYGFDYEVFAGKELIKKCNMKCGINEICFEIPEKIMPNGISIMYKALENSLNIQEKTITLITGGK
ncbi:MAG: radical SAM protein [Candidatus Muirbacterium halophilum]|nr:radical SAM protein [Candidatus Muirbacterium halophilum]MCK9475115.1 radical SAM protein [Candidatus Muirbacterium halophilum]